MILLLLVLLFIAVPIAELAVLIWVGGQIGLLPTIGLLIADSILGSLLMRSQGRAAWKRFNQALAERRPPAKEAMDGTLVIFGGALLLTPGFLSDILGVFLLLPPTRAIIRKLILWRFGGAILVTGVEQMGNPTRPTPGFGRRPPAAPPRRPHDVDGTATEIDP